MTTWLIGLKKPSGPVKTDRAGLDGANGAAAKSVFRTV
jgi:hypothetical protein